MVPESQGPQVITAGMKSGIKPRNRSFFRSSEPSVENGLAIVTVITYTSPRICLNASEG